MGAKTIPGGRPRYAREPRQHGHHNPPACHHKSYFLTCAEFDAPHDEADGHCQVCGKSANYLMIDHDHDLGYWAVRGLVCGVCNVGLGYIERGQKPTTDAAERYYADAWHLTRNVSDRQSREFPRAWCRWCSYPSPVRKDGRFSRHVVSGSIRCRGSERVAPEGATP